MAARRGLDFGVDMAIRFFRYVECLVLHSGHKHVYKPTTEGDRRSLYFQASCLNRQGWLIQ